MNVVAIGTGDASTEGRGRTALVTGASSGIGREIARLLAAKSYDVVLVARREDRLSELRSELESGPGVGVHVLPGDLSDPATPRRLAAELAERGIDIDFLVNNAGTSLVGNYCETDWEAQSAFFQLMGVSVLELTHRLLPGMVERRWGRIVNVASMAALLAASPQMALYSASKAMVVKFSEGIAIETAAFGVNVTASLPGVTESEILEASGIDGSGKLIQRAMMPAETVAREAYSAVMAGKPLVIHGRQNRLAAIGLLHTPAGGRRRLAQVSARLQTT